MKDISIDERAIYLAHYIINSKDTVRRAVKKFGISKSTVYKDVTLQNGRMFGKECIISNRTISRSIEITGVFEVQKILLLKLDY